MYGAVEEAGNNTGKDVANMQNFKVISDQVFHNIKMDTNGGQILEQSIVSEVDLPATSFACLK
mgnify:CR=1 FL=1